MNNPSTKNRRIRSSRSVTILSGALLAIVGAACSASAMAQAPGSSAAIEAVAKSLGVEYGQEQMLRLAKNNDRDSLIAAALIGLPSDGKSAPPEGHADVIFRLVGDYSSDPLALYTAALICNLQTQPCARGDDQVQLLRIAPGNAIHHLLLPNGGKPSAEQLHQAASAGSADSHSSPLLAIVRTALANQSPPRGEGGTDSAELALALRRNELADIPWPMFGPTMEICSADVAAERAGTADTRADCSNLGLVLFSDHGQSLVTLTYGGTLVRRFARGTPAEAAAREFRRQYLWIDELPAAATSAERELVNDEVVAHGEWEAFQRHAERAVGTRAPAADWVPKNPQALLLPEERTVAPSGQ